MFFFKTKKHFEDFFDENVTKVRGILYPIIGKDELDDATQDVFLKIWTSISSFESKAKLETWLYRVSINTGIDYLRKRKPKITFQENLNNETSDLKKLSNEDLIKKALSELNEEEIKIIVLHYFEERTTKEMANILEIKEGTLKRDLVNARNKLEKKIKELGGYYE